ncbi:MAG TPA: septation protein A [Ideonella sp.]|nr:septation protein A [Ideonella sp.]
MKILLDFLPLILFFASYKYADAHKEWASALATEYLGGLGPGGTVGPEQAPVLLATVVVIVATLAQVLFLKLRGRKVDLMLWVSLALVVVLGGLTIYFHSETFIKWKPSGLYWTLGLVLWVSQAMFRKNLLKGILGEQLVLPDKVWQRLNFAWVAFFGLMGLLNLWVAYSFDTSTWVDFKVFGVTTLMFVFTIGQAFYMNKYLPEEGAEPGKEAQP